MSRWPSKTPFGSRVRRPVVAKRRQIVDVNCDSMHLFAVDQLDDDDAAHRLRDVSQRQAHPTSECSPQRHEPTAAVRRSRVARPTNDELAEPRMIQLPRRIRSHGRCEPRPRRGINLEESVAQRADTGDSSPADAVRRLLSTGRRASVLMRPGDQVVSLHAVDDAVRRHPREHHRAGAERHELQVDDGMRVAAQ